MSVSKGGRCRALLGSLARPVDLALRLVEEGKGHTTGRRQWLLQCECQWQRRVVHPPRWCVVEADACLPPRVLIATACRHLCRRATALLPPPLLFVSDPHAAGPCYRAV